MQLKLFLILGKPETCVLRKVVLKKKRVYSNSNINYNKLQEAKPSQPSPHHDDCTYRKYCETIHSGALCADYCS